MVKSIGNLTMQILPGGMKKFYRIHVGKLKRGRVSEVKHKFTQKDTFVNSHFKM
jgi:hypothetical protein